MGRIAALLAPMMVSFPFFALADGEFRPLSGQEIRATLSDAKLLYLTTSAGEETAQENGIWQLFRTDGQTLYVSGDGGGAQSWGTWFVQDGEKGGQYCSTWPPSTHATCYDVTRSDDLVKFRGTQGDTYLGWLN